MLRQLALLGTAILGSQCFPFSSWAQEAGRPGATSAAPPSIQQQIDDLKSGQERLFEELRQIKALLQLNAPRADYPTQPVPASAISLDLHGEPFRGASTARVAIVEYSDFDCSFCSKYVREIYPKLDADYIQMGKVKYLFRDLPAPEHTNSLFKARAARCAGEQGRFWEMHDRLFELSALSKQTDIVALARALGLDVAPFQECLESDRYADAIQRSVAGAKRMGLHGTPAFIIGRVTGDGDFLRAAKVKVGAESYDEFKAVLDELLSGGTAGDPKMPRESGTK